MSAKYLVVLSLTVYLLTGCATRPQKPRSNLPRSHEATLLETTSSAEVMIRATGIGIFPKGAPPRKQNKILDKTANIDAERAALWFVLFGGTDPLLQTDEEKEKFNAIQESFFNRNNVRKYITWSAREYESRLKINGGKRLRIEKVVKINKNLLAQDLTGMGILTAKKDILKELGMPIVMVIPEATGDKSPLEMLKSDANYKKCAEVIESYLTAREYEAVAPEQQSQLTSLTFAQSQSADEVEDMNYLLALSIGSDVYITFSVQMTERRVGVDKVKKASVGIRAYETTTARLLGTETGYSEERLAAAPALIEEATNNAIDRVLSRVINYWKSDIQNGIRYRIQLSLDSYLTDQEKETASSVFSDALRQVSNKYKEQISTGQTLDYLVWANPDPYRNASLFYRDLKQAYMDFGGMGVLTRISLNRKLLHLKVEKN